MNARQVMQALAALGTDFTPAQMVATRELFAPRVLQPAQLEGCTVLRDIAYGPDSKQRLDLFMPPDVSQPRPVFVFVHGGGFVQGDKGAADAPFYNNVGAWAVREGYVGVAMTYRLAPAHPWPTGSADIAAALRWIAASVAQHGGDPSRLVLCGQSAGAIHVAGYLAGHGVEPGEATTLAGAVLVSGIYDLAAAGPSPMHDAYYGSDASLHAARSTIDALAATAVPCLYAVCERDPPEFQRQAAALVQARVARAGAWPAFAWLGGHNHLSSVLQLGSDVDNLGPALRGCIDGLVTRA